jgi:solute:Na+ symporter, SSS family
MNISALDTTIILVYLVFIVALGCWAGIRNRNKTIDKGGESYFLAGGTLRWPMIGLALFSTNISTIHLVSFAEEGYVNGLAYGNYEWMSAFTLIILALFFAPFYIRLRVATLPDFLERRYSRASRDWLAGLSIVSAIFIHIGFSLYAGAVVLEGMFGIPPMYSIIGIGVLTGVYTLIGGLMAVVITESVQTIILLAGAILLTAIALWEAGGMSGVTDFVEPVKLTMARPTGDSSGLPWYSVLLGYPIIGIWYWCTDQTIVQRVLGAKDENHARVGALFAGFIKILPVFIFIFPGIIYLALVKQGRFMPPADTGQTYAHMITQLLPSGLRGVMAAALLAALMSTVSGALNSTATLFSYDLYKRFKPKADDKHLIRVGQIVTFIGVILAILWSPHLGRFKTIFQGCAAVICYIAPPITAVFVFGVFWKRASSRGSIVTLISGTVLGFTVFLLDFFKDEMSAMLWNRFDIAWKWNVLFMMAGFYLFCICSAILMVSSLLWPDKTTSERMKLVWDSPLDALKSPGWRGLGNYKVLTVILLITMCVLYAIFW